MKTKYFSFLFTALMLAVITSCNKSDPEPLKERNSAAISFSYSDTALLNWISNPGKATCEAMFKFEEGLGDDVMFGISIELLEGKTGGLHFANADWMALVGLNRMGNLNFPVGDEENLQGLVSYVPKSTNINLGVLLQPDTWYKMKVEADFGTLHYSSFSLTGGDINVERNLSDYRVFLPGLIQIDTTAMMSLVYSLRSNADELYPEGHATVYFDLLTYSVERPYGYHTYLTSDFESQASVGSLPVTEEGLKFSQLLFDTWYLISNKALVDIVGNQSFSGDHSIRTDATLDGL